MNVKMSNNENANRIKKIVNKFVLPLAPVVIFLLITIFKPFFSIDARMTDSLHKRLDGVSRKIKLITVDEETLDVYGNFSEWSREKSAQLLEYLYSDDEKNPIAVGFDFLFVDEGNETADNALRISSQKAGNVVFASNLVYRGATKTDDKGNVYYDAWNVSFVENPYTALKEVTKAGFANVHIAADGRVRYTKVTEDYSGETYYSFSYALYEKLMQAEGKKPVMPKADTRGLFTFFYSGENGEYPHFSLKRVLAGEIPQDEFADCIVLVGAYAPGFQDAYIPTVGNGNPMYGVEIHANIIQALIDGKTAVAAPAWLYLLITAVVLYLYFFLAKFQKLIPVILEAVVLGGIHIYVGRMLALKGYTITQLYFLSVLFLMVIYFVIEKYFGERYRRKKVLATFKKYVAPQIVDKLAREGNFTLKLGGEKRNVAVLFVDIRGFTPMSENLQPEEVVSILNEYLALTTASILNNEGTLDKFIGDATMAVFNAPFDLDDYIFRAIKTALDIRDGSEKLREKLMEKFGKTISYGIGVNCGDAVVGNIGCEFRMDYTAIGDTVNTAARLESRAKAGEILISEDVYRKVEDRVIAEPVGEMELKGKSKAVKVYSLIDVKGN